jgi:hypothetical protein
VEGTHVFLKRKPSVLEVGSLAQCCPMRKEFMFERLLPEIIVFKVKKGPFCSK